MADPDLQKREGSGHPDPEIDGGGGAVLKKNFRLLGPQFGLIGSLSNDDTDGSENGKKAIGLISKTTTLHVHHAFFVHFFAVVARLQRESA